MDYSKQQPTLVEFKLEEMPGGTLPLIIESGFSNIPANSRDEAFRKNDGGWAAQLKNIERHVA